MTRVNFFLILLSSVFVLTGCEEDSAPLQVRSDVLLSTYHVSTSGNDATGDGSSGNPWRTIDHAVASVSLAGGHTILVGGGLYDGPIYIERAFSSEVVVKSAVPYEAMLTNVGNGDPILTVVLTPPDDGPVHITFEGFTISNEGTLGGPCSTRSGHMIFLSNISNFTFRNNIVYGNNRKPRCNNMIKVGIVGATQPWHDIRFEGNVFGSPPAVNGSDLLEVFEPTELDICDNIFYSCRGGGSGGSFVAIRRRWGATTRSPRYRISRNVFLNFEGSSTSTFLRIGGWDSPINDALVENNLMIGNSTTPMAAPVILEDASDITLRANTVVGDFPSLAFAFRLGTAAGGPAPENISVYNNIFSDPTATMGNLVDIYGNANIGATLFDNNLYWNGAGAVVHNDPSPIEADPLLLTDHSGIIFPLWDENARVFASGSRTVREEFERLVRTYGAIGAGSPARDAALPGQMPADDILGGQRDGAPDIGAFEAGSP